MQGGGRRDTIVLVFHKNCMKLLHPPSLHCIVKFLIVSHRCLCSVKVHSHCTLFSDCDYVFKMGYMAVNGSVHTMRFSEVLTFPLMHSVNEP